MEPPFHPNCKCTILPATNPYYYIKCKPGVFCYEESVDQKFCFMNVGGYEFIVYLN